jgi:protein-disulfide isomerase
LLNRKTATQVAIVLLLIIILTGIGAYLLAPAYSTSYQTIGSLVQQTSTTSSLATSLLAGSPPTLGSQTAPVTIVEFGDYQCPTCGAWYNQQEASVIQNLVNMGRAKLVWRDFDYYGPDSVSASEAAYAAGEQGKFWQFHDFLFKSQQTPNNGWASRQSLVTLAGQFGLNMTQFNQSFNSGKYDSLINANHDLGVQAGVSETPVFFLVGQNGNMVTIAGAQPESVFDQAVTQLTGSPTPEYPSSAAVLLVVFAVALTIITARNRVRKRRSS